MNPQPPVIKYSDIWVLRFRLQPRLRSSGWRLLDGDALGEVARTVDVTAPQHSDVIGQKLKRHHRQKWLERLRQRRNLEHRIAKLIADTPAAGYIGCADAIRALDITARIGAIRAPALVIAGADDPGTPPAMSEVIAATIPGARLEIIPSASHLSCIEQPETFNRLVAAFLKG